MFNKQPTATEHLTMLLGIGATDNDVWHDIRRFEAAAEPLIRQQWDVESMAHIAAWRIANPAGAAAQAEHKAKIAAIVEQLHHNLGAAANRGAAALHLYPQLWQPSYQSSRYNYNSPRYVLMLLHKQVAATTIAMYPPADWSKRVAQRIVTLCSAAVAGDDPNLVDCVGFLLNSPDQRVAPFLDALTWGDWASAAKHVARLAGTRIMPHRTTLSEQWLPSGARHSAALLQRVFGADKLNAKTFARFLSLLPNSLRDVNSYLATCAADDFSNAAFVAALQGLLGAVIWTLLDDFRSETWETLASIHHLSGGHYLIRLIEHVEQLGLAPLRSIGYSASRADNVLVRMFGVLRRDKSDDPAALTDLLRRFAPTTLLAVLPHADQYRPEVIAALAWPHTTALLDLLQRLNEHDPARSADPTLGVIHRAAVLTVVEAMDPFQLASLLSAFEPHHPTAVTLVRAVLGENRKELRRLFGRRNQLAARALGLLPLEKPTELVERYGQLTRFFREANTSAAGRKNYERAAAQAGLSNLALQAGFADSTRLEWAMEDQLGTEAIALGRIWEIEGYTLTLALRAGKAVLNVQKGERSLKRVPAVVTREYEYRAVKATVEAAQDQTRRYRTTFLEAMRRDQPLSADEIALLRRNPLAVDLLSRLVLLDDVGASGLYCADDNTLEGTHGERVPITGAVRIAHPLALNQYDVLGDWQAEIVRRELVQPFKQVFREIYVITPAEIEAGFASARLAGRRMKGRQSSAVLANMGWLIDGYSIRKPLYDLGYAAHFETGAYGGYDDGDDSTGTSGALEFWPLKYERNDGQERRINLADVPPLVFSEIMRDLDLVTVVAHQSDEYATSKEVLHNRANLVRATVGALGLRQVSIEEPHVVVAGKLASYRIHLATGAIYLANGQYLCIVPSRKQQNAVYLPFEEGGDSVSSEVISKILLLANDTRISDPSIVAQIRG